MLIKWKFYITYANGTSVFVDTTEVFAITPYLPPTLNISGYYYPLICNATSCQTATLCSGAYCDAVKYYTSENYYSSCTTSGYVVGADNLCHLECGGVDEYCNSRYSCNTYYNECVT